MHEGELSSPLSIALRTRQLDSQQPDVMRAIGYDDTDPLTFLVGGGSIFQALKAARGAKVCDQTWLENSVKLTNDFQFAQPIDSFLFSLAVRSSFRPPRPELIVDTLHALEHECQKHQLLTEYPKPQTLEPLGGDYLVAQAELVKQLQDSAFSAEQRKILVVSFQERFDPKQKMQRFGETINKLLDHPRSTGVGIGHLYRALGSTINPSSIGGHASAIIGRRYSKENQTCEFLVRDSYGSSCTTADANQRYTLPCERGSVWVEARRLLRDTMSLTWIPNLEPAHR